MSHSCAHLASICTRVLSSQGLVKIKVCVGLQWHACKTKNYIIRKYGMEVLCFK